MVGSSKRRECRALEMYLIFHIMGLLLTTAACFELCPESLRQSTATRAPNIPDSEVEKAFEEADEMLFKRRLRESRLHENTVNKYVKSTDSAHPQANAPQRVRDMEAKQEVFDIATGILAMRFKLSQEQVICGLPNMQLPESFMAAQDSCRREEMIECNRSAKYRTADGKCNNLDNPTWGSAFSCFRRLLASAFGVYGSLRMSVGNCRKLPNPRTLSLNVHSNVNRRTNNVNHLYVFFGQLLDHDLTFTAQSLDASNGEPIQCCVSGEMHDQCAPLEIHHHDPFYSRYNVTCLNFVRSAICPICTLGPRTQINTVTSFIDASFVYGNNNHQMKSLRKFNGTGELLAEDSEYGSLLPSSFNPNEDRCSVQEQNRTCFTAGDSRVNQHSMLAALHTLFVREHNRIARELKKLNPQYDEETLFQEVRRIIGAVMQVITYRDYLPTTVGNNIMSSYNLWNYYESTYDKDMDPSCYTEFSTAAFRYGHSMVNSLMAEEPRRPGHAGHVLRDSFFQPYTLRTGDMDPLLRGATKSNGQYFDRHVISDLTNYLYRIRGRPTGSDLPALNIQRGRDHGIRGYAAYAGFCHPQQVSVNSFDDLVDYHFMSPENMALLRKNYENVEDIDLFTGILSEIHLPDSVLGPTGACIVARQFRALKLGDRFFYMHGGQSGSFTYGQQIQLRYYASLARMLCDNTGITEVQRNPMMFPSNSNPIVPCRQITGMNLGVWQQK